MGASVCESVQESVSACKFLQLCVSVREPVQDCQCSGLPPQEASVMTAEQQKKTFSV